MDGRGTGIGAGAALAAALPGGLHIPWARGEAERRCQATEVQGGQVGVVGAGQQARPGWAAQGPLCGRGRSSCAEQRVEQSPLGTPSGLLRSGVLPACHIHSPPCMRACQEAAVRAANHRHMLGVGQACRGDQQARSRTSQEEGGHPLDSKGACQGSAGGSCWPHTPADHRHGLVEGCAACSAQPARSASERCAPPCAVPASTAACRLATQSATSLVPMLPGSDWMEASPKPVDPR